MSQSRERSQSSDSFSRQKPSAAHDFMAFGSETLLARDCVAEKVSCIMMTRRCRCTLAPAYDRIRYLGGTIDLLLAVQCDYLKAPFNSTKEVVNNRFTLEPDEDFAEDMRA